MTDTVTDDREKVTFRAVFLGILTVLIMVLYITYYGFNLIKNYMPVAALLPLVGWVSINSVMKGIAPRFALSRTEMLTVFWVVWIVSSLPATGWAGYVISNISAPEHFASAENQVREVVFPYLKRSFFLGPSEVVVGQLYGGLEPDIDMPWRPWAEPLFWWISGGLSIAMAGFFCNVLFYKQWHNRERLTFPLAVFPLDLMETERGKVVPDVFRNWLFWIGFAFAAGIICWNVVGYFQPTIVKITLFDHWRSKAVPIGYHFPNYYLRVQPLIMGLAYLAPLDLSFSFWFYNMFQILKTGLMNMTGISVGMQGQQEGVVGILRLESHGALTLLVVWSLWVARAHLKETFRKALSAVRQADDGVPVTYRTAWVGLVASSIFWMGWCVTSGMGLFAAVVQMVLIFICFFGVTKYAAATGFTFLDPAGGKGAEIMRSIVGTANLSPGTQVTMWMTNGDGMLGRPIRVTSIVSVPHFFRMLGNQLRRNPLIWSAVPLSFVIASVFSAAATLFRSYSEGGMNGTLSEYLGNWGSLENQVSLIAGIEPTFFDGGKLGVWFFGVAEAGILLYLRSVFTWWPFHPAAIAFPTRQYGFSLLLVWVIKSLVIRYGGVTLFRRSLPLWYGLMVGYLLGVGISTTVDAIWFPGPGHWVHGW